MTDPLFSPDSQTFAIIAAVGAGAWQTLRSAATWASPRVDRLIEATEATAKSTAEHTAVLGNLQAARTEMATSFGRFADSHETAKLKAFADHERLEALARQAISLCQEILVEVKKQ